MSAPGRCPYPTVRFVAFNARKPRFIFVADPSIRGRYVMTDMSVALVACPLCGAIPCEPCKTPQGNYHAGTHCARRDAAKRMDKSNVCDVIKPRIKLKTRQTL